jgi:hypothetical protein
VHNALGLYGPIVLDTNSVEVLDPKLNQCQGGGQTMVACAGTHFHHTESRVNVVIDGFLSAANHDSDTQFFKFENVTEEALKNPRDNDRFRIVDWLEAEPASIMKHQKVVACIYHGGANSYQKAALWVDQIATLYFVRI